jgi:hypothetical protein
MFFSIVELWTRGKRAIKNESGLGSRRGNMPLDLENLSGDIADPPVSDIPQYVGYYRMLRMSPKALERVVVREDGELHQGDTLSGVEILPDHEGQDSGVRAAAILCERLIAVEISCWTFSGVPSLNFMRTTWCNNPCDILILLLVGCSAVLTYYRILSIISYEIIMV